MANFIPSVSTIADNYLNSPDSSKNVKEKGASFEDSLKASTIKRPSKISNIHKVTNSNIVNFNGANNLDSFKLSQKVADHQSPLMESQNINSSMSSMSDGIEVAKHNKIREYAVKMERHMYVSMWQKIYEMGSFNEKQVGETLYASEFIRELVNKAYNDKGGPMADAIYENAKRQQGIK